MYCSLRNDFLLQFWDTLGTISRAGEPKRLDGLDIAVRVGDLFCLCHEISGGLALRPLTQHLLLVLSAHQPHFIPQSEKPHSWRLSFWLLWRLHCKCLQGIRGSLQGFPVVGKPCNIYRLWGNPIINSGMYPQGRPVRPRLHLNFQIP